MLEQSLTSSSPTFWAGLYSWFTPTIFFLLLQLVIATIYITSTLANATQKHHQQQDPNFPQPHHQQLFRSPSVLQRLKSINFYSYQPNYRSQQEQPQQLQTYENEIHVPQLARSPSVLQRLKSINLYSYLPTQPFTTKLSPDNSNNVFTHETHKQHVEVKETEEEHEEDDVLGHIRDNLGGNYEEEGHVSIEEVFMKLLGQGGNFTRTHSDTKPDSGEVPVKLSRKMKKSASSKSAFSHFKEDDIVEKRRPATVKEAKVVPAAVDEDELVDSKADDFINKFKHQLKLQRIDSIMRYKDMINKGSSK